MINTLSSLPVFINLINCGLAATLVCTLVLLAKWIFALTPKFRIGRPTIIHNMLSISIVFLLAIPLCQTILGQFGFGVIGVANSGAASSNDFNFAAEILESGLGHHIAAAFSGFIATPVLRWAIELTWLTGALFFAVRFLLGMFWIRRLCLETTSSDDERLNQIFEESVNAIVPSRRPQLALTKRKIGPLVCGVRQPTIIISHELALLLSDSELQAILIHECEHVRRRDVLLSIAEQIASCVYWWNPLVIAVRQCIVKVRERACDDRVFAMVSSPKTYAAALLTVAQWSIDRPKVIGVVSLLPRRNDLVDRISRAQSTDWNSNDHGIRQWLVPVTVAMSVAFLASMPIFCVLPASERLRPLSQDLNHSDARVLAQHQLAYVRINRGSRADMIEKLLRDNVPELSRGLIVDLRDSERHQRASKNNPSEDLYQMVQRQIAEYETGGKSRRPVVVLVQKQGVPSAVMLRRELPGKSIRPSIPPSGPIDDPQLRMAIDLLSHV